MGEQSIHYQEVARSLHITHSSLIIQFVRKPLIIVIHYLNLQLLWKRSVNHCLSELLPQCLLHCFLRWLRLMAGALLAYRRGAIASKSSHLWAVGMSLLGTTAQKIAQNEKKESEHPFFIDNAIKCAISYNYAAGGQK